MEISEFVDVLKATGYPVAYYAFRNTESSTIPEPPFIVYTIVSTENLHADNQTYMKVYDIEIELYTDTKDFDTEKALEQTLYENKIPWESYETYIDSEKLYQKIYEVRLIVDE